MIWGKLLGVDDGDFGVCRNGRKGCFVKKWKCQRKFDTLGLGRGLERVDFGVDQSAIKVLSELV